MLKGSCISLAMCLFRCCACVVLFDEVFTHPWTFRNEVKRGPFETLLTTSLVFNLHQPRTEKA
jgi:hypothetical protein